jgi:hypothetical protein
MMPAHSQLSAVLMVSLTREPCEQLREILKGEGLYEASAWLRPIPMAQRLYPTRHLDPRPGAVLGPHRAASAGRSLACWARPWWNRGTNDRTCLS